MKKNKIIFLFMFIAIISDCIFGQPLNKENYKFAKIGVEEGLSQSSVYSILQDSEGYMWFATANGLNRYDGYEFVVYSTDPNDSLSLSDNSVTALFEDNKESLWVGTSTGVLNKFDRTTETFTRFDIAASSDWFTSENTKINNYPVFFIRNNFSTITSIAQDKDGNLWIGTWGKGLIKFNPHTQEKKYFYSYLNDTTSLSSNIISDILIDEQNYLWVGTFGGGLNRANLNLNTNNISFGKCNTMQKQITKLYEDDKGNLWVASYDYGISVLKNNERLKKAEEINTLNYNKKKSENLGFNRNDIMSVVQYEGDIWFGTFGGGLFRFDKKKFFNLQANPLDEYSLSENEVISLYVDKSGVLWAGTNLGSGINKLQKGKDRFFTLPVKTRKYKSLNDDIIWEIYEDKEQNIWIGTFRGGVNIYNPKNKTFKYLQKENKVLRSNHIRSIIQDKYGNFWIGTYSGGLTFYNGRTGRKRVYLHNKRKPNSLSGNEVHDLFIENDSLLWVGLFGGGLDKLDLQKFYKTGRAEFINFVHNPANPFSITSNRVYKIFKSKTGIMWIATFGGGFNKFNSKRGVFKGFTHSDRNNSLSDNRVMTIEETADGKLLIGTFGGGLDLFNPADETFFHLREGLELPCNDIYGILKDDFGRFWLSSDIGIFKLESDLKAFTQYDLNDGLQSLEFNGGAYLKAKDGTFYFGGIKGLNYFYPDSIIENGFNPSVVISRIKIFDEIIKGAKKKLVLNRDQNYFSFEFASLDYVNPQKNKYKYILEGLDSKWTSTDAANRKVNYTNLAPGKYKFKVLGTNSDGLWSTKEASIEIEILAPFWMKWWFITLVIFTLVALISFFVYQRFKYFIAMDELKNKLAADLHDNVGAGLTEISILTEIAAHEIDKPAQATKYLGKVSQLSRNLVDSMSDIVWVVNPKQDSLYDLIVRLKDTYGEMLGQLGIRLETTNLEKLNSIRLPLEQRQNIYLIFKEALNNSIKHSNCTHIKFDIKINRNKLILSIEDNGKGFDVNKQTQGNGLKNMQERASKIGGKLIITSEINNGMKITYKGTIK